jgi:hypothetical protein
MRVGNLYVHDQTGIFEKCWVLITHSNPCEGLIIWEDGAKQRSTFTDQDFLLNCKLWVNPLINVMKIGVLHFDFIFSVITGISIKSINLIASLSPR